MFSTLTGKPFDIDSLCASWPDAPRFHGDSKKDPKVEAWLKAIEEGCSQRKVPKKCWHTVGQRYMGKHACDRLLEVKKVMMKLSKGVFNWDWKKFAVAMGNMNWDIDIKRTLPFRLDMIPGLWWMAPAEKTKEAAETVPSELNKPFLQRTLKIKSDAEKLVKTSASPQAKRSHVAQKTDACKKAPEAPKKSQAKDAQQKSSASSVKPKKMPLPTPQSKDQNTRSWTLPLMRKDDPVPPPVADAPEWLLAACQALDAISTEYPKTMSVVAAVLLTIGSVPNLPVAAGTALAGTTAHAIGNVALGLGSLIGAHQHAATESA